MKKFGVKLWSKDFVKNPDFVKDCVKTVNDGLFDYVELFALPNSFDDTKDVIKSHLSGINVVIHAPHSLFGLDTGDKTRFSQNIKDLDSSQKFADMLNSEIIILHSGLNQGDEYLAETIRQFNIINDPRIAVENLPSYCSSTSKLLHGTSPAEIKKIISETGCKFCLDFSHAICAANAFDRDVLTDLAQYASLNPDMYHLCDGDITSDKDEHRHFGLGNYDLRKIVRDYTSDDAIITMETGYGIPTSSTPWIDDISYIRNIIK